MPFIVNYVCLSACAIIGSWRWYGIPYLRRRRKWEAFSVQVRILCFYVFMFLLYVRMWMCVCAALLRRNRNEPYVFDCGYCNCNFLLLLANHAGQTNCKVPYSLDGKKRHQMFFPQRWLSVTTLFWWFYQFWLNLNDSILLVLVFLASLDDCLDLCVMSVLTTFTRYVSLFFYFSAYRLLV